MAGNRDDAGNWPISRLLSEVMGSGPKSADDMTYRQARSAFAQIISDEPDPTTLGAFLLANRWKRNTPEELAGFVDEMRDRSVRTAEPTVDPVDCGANYDGKESTALLGVAAGIVAAGAGTPVVVHSADRVPATRGCAYRHVLDEVGIPTDLAPAESTAMVDETGFGFYYGPRFNPGVDALLDRREAMAVRTFINTIETLANPANASVHLGSFFHLPFAERVIESVRESRVPVERVVMVQGLEGYDDVRPGRTRVAEWTGDSIEDYRIETSDYGMDLRKEDLEVGDVAGGSARVTEAVITGNRDDGVADAVAVNAGLRIYARGDAATLGVAVETAREAIRDGSAAAVLSGLRQFQP